MSHRARHEISPFTSDELGRWTTRLLEIRRGLLRDLGAVAEASVVVDAKPDDVAEAAAATELAIATTQEVHETVQLIDAALAKITARKPVPFGICEETGMPIERDRLNLMPWTPVSSAGARLREHPATSTLE